MTEERRRHRVPLKLPGDLVRAAGACARLRGDVLTDFVHHAVITATKAAEAGRGDLLPPRRPRNVKAHPEPAVVMHYTASRDQASRSATALERVGSSRQAVVVAALDALVMADGVWLDVRLPWEPGLSACTCDEDGADTADGDDPVPVAGAA